MFVVSLSNLNLTINCCEFAKRPGSATPAYIGEKDSGLSVNEAKGGFLDRYLSYH